MTTIKILRALVFTATLCAIPANAAQKPALCEAPEGATVEVVDLVAARCAEALDKAPKGVERTGIAIALSRLYFRNGHVDKTASVLRNAVVNAPDDPELLREAALFESGNGDKRKARLWFSRLIELHPDDAGLLAMAGDNEWRLNALTQAMGYYDKALGIDPTHMPGLRSRQQLATKLGRYDAALADLDTLIALDPDNALHLVDRAGVLLAKGDPDGALAQIETARQRFPQVEPWTLPVLIRIQLARGDSAAAGRTLAQLRSATGGQLPPPLADEFASLLEGGNGDRAPAAGRFFDEVFRIARNIRTRNDILRLQVFLRNRGFESVVITGRLDGPTRTATERCSTDDPCAAEFITFVPCPTQCETPVERKPVESVARRS